MYSREKMRFYVCHSFLPKILERLLENCMCTTSDQEHSRGYRYQNLCCKTRTEETGNLDGETDKRYQTLLSPISNVWGKDMFRRSLGGLNYQTGDLHEQSTRVTNLLVNIQMYG